MKIWTKRILLFLICAGIAGCLAVVWLSAYVKSETVARILSTEEAAKQDADCILVLGCGVRPDGTPSLMLTDRLETGIALYRAGAAEKLLMSGDHGTEDYDEVNTMKNIAKETACLPQIFSWIMQAFPPMTASIAQRRFSVRKR